MRRYRYYICDVFTDRRFGGNQLAVLPEAEGLSDAEMQQIAREFNFSETTFVLPPEVGNTRRVRIFTPTSEIPFAGHPNVGTAFVLAATGALGALGGVSSISVIFEERAGLVPIGIDLRDGVPTRCQLDAPQALSLGKTTSPERAAEALSLSAADVVIATHPPQEASVGLPFLIVELSGREALARARPDLGAFESLVSDGLPSGIHAYVQSADEFDLRARMFAPLDGVPEDPATGSATCALAGMLAFYSSPESSPESSKETVELRWRIAQGVEMGRPSVLEARAVKRQGEVVTTSVGGACVMVGEGFLDLDPGR